MRQQMSRTQKYKSAHPDEMVGVTVQHHTGHLALLVTRHVHAPLDAQCGQLVVFLALGSNTFFTFQFIKNIILIGLYFVCKLL